MEEEGYCDVCGNHRDEDDNNAIHIRTPRHISNLILRQYQANKKAFSSNRDGIKVLCSAESLPFEDAPVHSIQDNDGLKVRMYVKPNQTVVFTFDMYNEMRNEDVRIVGVLLAHPQNHFKMNDHDYIFGDKNTHTLRAKSSLKAKIVVKFVASDISQFEMPVIFTFERPKGRRNHIVIRELVVNVQDNSIIYDQIKSPYTKKKWPKAERFYPAVGVNPISDLYKVPYNLKHLFVHKLQDTALNSKSGDEENNLRILLMDTRNIFDNGIDKTNYTLFFRHLLWWEETAAKINLKKYNMTEVNISKWDRHFLLNVPGLAEKRPSLLRGDRVYIMITGSNETMFESIITDFKDDSVVQLSHFHNDFYSIPHPEVTFEVRFIISRVSYERMHEAVTKVFMYKQGSRVFPEPNEENVKVFPITKFYNELIKTNEEQKAAVEHIVAGASGTAPYMVFGPPGTGKTMTIVEAIIQLVVRNSRNRILVCTDSNMAADHIALALLQYNHKLRIKNFIIRANSQSRIWDVMPPELGSVSNGTSYKTFYPVDNAYLSRFHIVVTTLMHAAKYGLPRHQDKFKLQMSHLFVDEAAQASEPATLVPVTSLLSPRGQLVLAGDPQQLGPVCISKEVKDRGLGMSMMERLYISYPGMYSIDHLNYNYITMLVKNFRSDPRILELPNEMFYNNSLKAFAKPDPLSNVNILGPPFNKGGDKAIIFHSVNSSEQKMGSAPSYYNEKELDMLKRYIEALLLRHKVFPKDIGIIAPYIRQVYKVKHWLGRKSFEGIEVGTVESFQGKEKRVILVSTVRANSKLLDYDARYGLGFLVDDKRFNVALTRAKAKLIIIGNPACLKLDLKWRKYMNLCKELGCYFGADTEQMERSAVLLTEVTKTRFDKCRLTEALDEMKEGKNKKKKKSPFSKYL